MRTAFIVSFLFCQAGDKQCEWNSLHILVCKTSGLYQGTTFSRADRSAAKIGALAPAKPDLPGAEAQVVMSPLATRLKPCPDTKQLCNRSQFRNSHLLWCVRNVLQV